MGTCLDNDNAAFCSIPGCDGVMHTGDYLLTGNEQFACSLKLCASCDKFHVCKSGHSEKTILELRLELKMLRCYAAGCDSYYCPEDYRAGHDVCSLCTVRDAKGEILAIKCRDCCQEH